MKKRLFITTGNLSLLNALTLIKMHKEKYDDYLVIFSFNMPEKFVSTNKQMARLGNFKQIEFVHNWKETKFNFSDFDEIYAVAGIKINHSHLYWFDEGTSYVYKSFCYPNFPEKTFYWKYLNKLLPFNLSINQEPDKKVFLDICSQIEKMDKNKPIIPKGKKTALITGQYILTRLYTQNEKMSYYEHIIAELQAKGFSVYLKPHPREELEPYLKLKERFKTNFYLFDSYFPLEVYQLDFSLVISCACAALFSLPDFRNIPTACSLPKLWKGAIKQFIGSEICHFMYANEYIPDYTYLLQDINKGMKITEVKRILNQKFSEYVGIRNDIISSSKFQSLMRGLKWNKILGKILGNFCPFKQYRVKIRKIDFCNVEKIVKEK